MIVEDEVVLWMREARFSATSDERGGYQRIPMPDTNPLVQSAPLLSKSYTTMARCCVFIVG